MKRAEAIETVLTVLNDELVVHANGFICRESFVLNDRPQNFYMIGSMGLAPSIGLGIAINKPDRKVVIFDGDGNVLMNMGTLAQVGTLCPDNFYHFVFDNEVYGSTGNQPTLTKTIKLAKIARAAGYVKTYSVINAEDLHVVAKECLKTKGPAFILIKVNTECNTGIERISHCPEEIKKEVYGCNLIYTPQGHKVKFYQLIFRLSLSVIQSRFPRCSGGNTCGNTQA